MKVLILNGSPRPAGNTAAGKVTEETLDKIRRMAEEL